MEKRHYIGKGIFALLVVAATLAGCSKDSDNNDNPTPPEVQDPYKGWPTQPKIKEGETSYISFYTQREVGEAFIFNLYGNGWIDLNNNGVQDPDEKTELFMGDKKISPLPSQVFTIYGKINTLNAFDCRLKGLDVSHTSNLEDLRVEINSLTELNLKENRGLTYLSAYENKLPQLDLKENKDLTYLNLSKNAIEQLDLTENKALTYLDIAENAIRQLNLAENKALTNLYAAKNAFQQLDLTKNEALTDLEVSNNQLTALDLRANTQLTWVDLSGNKLSEEAMLKTVESLPQREEASQGKIVLQTFRIVEGKQEVENNKPNEEALKKLGAKKWKAQFINKEGEPKEYNGKLNAPHEKP